MKAPAPIAARIAEWFATDDTAFAKHDQPTG
jgi:hypothetical protein